MKITRIAAPKFKVGRYTLNEYEVRQLMLEVRRGEKSAGITVKDISHNVTASIQEDGRLSNNLPSFAVAYELTKQLLK